MLAYKSTICNSKYVGNVSDTMYLSIKLNVLPLNSTHISLMCSSWIILTNQTVLKTVMFLAENMRVITPVLNNTAHNCHCFISNAFLMARRTKTPSNNLSFSREKNKRETKIASINAQISS